VSEEVYRKLPGTVRTKQWCNCLHRRWAELLRNA